METLTRWWAPEGKVPVAHLLRRGPDPQKDLGLALFAVHKAGAEACELVARTAVADELVLATALAETRAAVAPPAVQVVSKAVESPQYAGLLLADLFDDAESAALSLYRSCLAKSVAPPVAAQRVGMVFGVPSRELGKFSKLATDPKATPAAVQDAADRALFGYVAKVVAEEYVPAKELVSKAPVRDYHGREPGERDEGGQFARVGARPQEGSRLRERAPQTQVGDGGADNKIDLQALFDAAADHAEPVKEAAPPEVGRVSRKSRKTRDVRRSRASRSSAETATELEAQQLQGRLSAPTLRTNLTAHDLLAQQLTFDQFTPMPLTGMERTVPDLKARRPAPDGLREPLGEPVSFILQDKEFLALTRKATDAQDGTHVFRLGGLVEYAGDARHYQDGSGDRVWQHEDHVDGVHIALDIINSQAEFKGQPSLVVGAVPIVELVGEDPDRMLQEHKKIFLEKAAAALKLSVNPATELTNVQSYQDRDDRTLMRFVWRPPSTDEMGKRRAARPIPGIVEMVIDKGQVAGSVDRHGRIAVDPNAAMKVKGLFRPRGKQTPPSRTDPLQRQTYWDNRLKAVRTIVTMVQAPQDEIGKAMTSQQFRQHEQAGRITRDPSTGEFVDLQAMFDEATVRHAEPLSTAPRPKRKMRRSAPTRRTRQGREAEPQSLTGVKLQGQVRGKRVSAEVKASAVRASMLSREGRNSRDNTILWIDDDSQYTVPPAGVVWQMSQEDSKGFPETIDRDWVLGPLAKEYLLKHGRVVANAETDLDIATGSDAEQALFTSHLDAWNETVDSEEADSPIEGPLTKQVIHDPVDLDDIAKSLAEKFRKDPNLSLLRLEFRIKTGRKVELTVYGNREALPVQHLMRYGAHAVPDRPVKLVPGNVWRMHNAATIGKFLHQQHLSALSYGQDVEQPLPNPMVKAWTVE